MSVLELEESEDDLNDCEDVVSVYLITMPQVLSFVKMSSRVKVRHDQNFFFCVIEVAE